jgi:predicted dinucleotide-binding enzyme
MTSASERLAGERDHRVILSRQDCDAVPDPDVTRAACRSSRDAQATFTPMRRLRKREGADWLQADVSNPIIARFGARIYIGWMKTIALIGAGHIGSQVARLAIAHGYHVVISNSRGPETLSPLIAELGPNARAVTPVDAANAGDLVVVTIPLKNYRQVPVEPLAGKIVIDTNNYYPQRDGYIPELDSETKTSAELLQAHLPTSKVIKAFNHIYASQITTDGTPPGTKNRRALVIAGDDAAAKATVTKLFDELGFDTVDAGPLSESWRIQPGTPGYGPRRNAEESRRDLAAAKRPAGS